MVAWVRAQTKQCNARTMLAPCVLTNTGSLIALPEARYRHAVAGELGLRPRSTPEVPSLFRKVHIDTFLMPKVGSYRYVLHARDALTSYPEGRATTSETGQVIADFIFQEILCRWGALEDLVTDNGPPYIAALDILAKHYGIHHIRISGYNSRANGLVESKHFDVREAIMKTCKGKESNTGGKGALIRGIH